MQGSPRRQAIGRGPGLTFAPEGSRAPRAFAPLPGRHRSRRRSLERSRPRRPSAPSPGRPRTDSRRPYGAGRDSAHGGHATRPPARPLHGPFSKPRPRTLRSACRVACRTGVPSISGHQPFYDPDRDCRSLAVNLLDELAHERYLKLPPVFILDKEKVLGRPADIIGDNAQRTSILSGNAHTDEVVYPVLAFGERCRITCRNEHEASPQLLRGIAVANAGEAHEKPALVR